MGSRFRNISFRVGIIFFRFSQAINRLNRRSLYCLYGKIYCTHKTKEEVIQHFLRPPPFTSQKFRSKMKLNLPSSSYLAAIAILPVAPLASADAATSDKSSDPSHYRNLRSGGVVDGADRESASAAAGDAIAATTMTIRRAEADPASVKCAEDNFTEEIMYDFTGGKFPINILASVSSGLYESWKGYTHIPHR